MVVSLFASVSFVTVIAGLPSDACPETEYELDYSTGLELRKLEISLILFNFTGKDLWSHA